MILVLAAGAIFFGSLPFYIVVIAHFAIINYSFCPFEEANLERAFGDTCRYYRSNVRRWI